jgi:hypothetical protein
MDLDLRSKSREPFDYAAPFPFACRNLGKNQTLFEDSWSTDPADLDFSEFRNRHIWGPPDSSGSRECIDLALLRKPFPYSIEQRLNPYPNGEDADYEHGRKPSMLAAAIWLARPSRCPSFSGSIRRPSMNGSAWHMSGAWPIPRGCLFSHRRNLA